MRFFHRRPAPSALPAPAPSDRTLFLLIDKRPGEEDELYLHDTPDSALWNAELLMAGPLTVAPPVGRWFGRFASRYARGPNWTTIPVGYLDVMTHNDRVYLFDGGEGGPLVFEIRALATRNLDRPRR